MNRDLTQAFAAAIPQTQAASQNPARSVPMDTTPWAFASLVGVLTMFLVARRYLRTAPSSP